nr:thiamine diphosphokinase [uncultured Acetatifactor sp.]
MKQGICYLVCAGRNTGLDFTPTANDYVIAVDGGLRYLEEARITPNLIIGDFDTLGYCPTHSNVVRLNPQKDETDTLAALKEGILEGFSQFHLCCGTGGRIEHTIANIQLLAFLSQNGRQGFLHDGENVLTTITDCQLTLPRRDQGFLSVFSHSDECQGVNLHGLKYELNNAFLRSTFPLGISNEFKGMESSISVKKGTLLLVLPRDILPGIRILPSLAKSP